MRCVFIVNLKMENALYLEIFNSLTNENIHYLECPLKTLQTLCIYKYCSISDIHVYFVVNESINDTPCAFKVKLNEFKCTILKISDLSWQVSSCVLPVVTTEHTVITGLCAVARHLCKYKKSHNDPGEHPQGILGFRSGCLQAPNEVSVWTKFCEIEIFETAQHLICNNEKISKNEYNSVTIPEDIVRFEYHLRQPLKVHNVYKLARDMAKLSMEEVNNKSDTDNREKNELTDDIKTDKVVRTHVKRRQWKSKNSSDFIESSTPIEDLNLDHEFAEGPFITLADVFLYPLFCLMFSQLKAELLEMHIPKTIKWFRKLKSLNSFNVINELLVEISVNKIEDSNFIYLMPEVKEVSLYKTDPKRSNPRKRLFTKEDDVEAALKLITRDLELIATANNLCDSEINWSDVPSEANPYGGHLPDKRMARKTQQLENLVMAVMKLAQNGDRIVDFCSGSGHLGILLAHLLPQCTIVLLENKEQSLLRAQTRVQSLGLNNVYFFQCNLDFFSGQFDIGVALHACGIATDLVLENCINRNASFVVCPCCYGSLHSTNRLIYPKSKDFAEIPVEQYLCIGHAADQTHVNHPMEQRGARCMTIIDSDRARHAMEHGYSVSLKRLDPLSCTPKNMLIVGIAN